MIGTSNTLNHEAKFDKYPYWKHKNCRDVFIRVVFINKDDGEQANLSAAWMTQGVASFWACSKIDPIYINKREYENWKPYIPVGKYHY